MTTLTTPPENKEGRNDSPAKQSYGELKTQTKLYHFSRGGGMSSGIDS